MTLNSLITLRLLIKKQKLFTFDNFLKKKKITVFHYQKS